MLCSIATPRACPRATPIPCFKTETPNRRPQAISEATLQHTPAPPQLHLKQTPRNIPGHAGCKAELSELLFPLRLKFEELGGRQALSTDKQRGDWHRDLRHRWDGSLVVFTAQHATDTVTLLGLVRLCSMLRYPRLSQPAS